MEKARKGAEEIRESRVSSAGGDAAFGTRLFADGTPKETVIAFFATKGTHENKRQQESFENPFCS
jgi:hypothetical protein